MLERLVVAKSSLCMYNLLSKLTSILTKSLQVQVFNIWLIYQIILSSSSSLSVSLVYKGVKALCQIPAEILPLI